jgi:class 3 adenylate cyclase
MTTPYLEWIDENQQVQRLEIFDKVFIGRTCQGVDPQKRIILPDPSVSRDHAVISRKGSGLQITDRSKNGTWVNGVRLASDSFKDLETEYIIHIGDSFFKVVFPQYAFVENNAETATGSTIIKPTEVVITNLVADIRRFSEFSQVHASSEVFEIIKGIFDSFSGVVNEFRGTIKDYAGDAVYAFWDHQTETPQVQAGLACRAAVQQTRTLRKILGNLSETYCDADKLQMGWGITTGNVTMSHYGLRIADMALVGDCINLAFRLSDIANIELSENIVICSQTAKLVRNELQLKDLGKISVRGRKGKEHLFALSEWPP